MNPGFPVVSGGLGLGMGNIPMTNGVPTANLIALLHLQQQQGLQTIQQQAGGIMGMPGQIGIPGMPGIGMMPPPELAALMMSSFTPKPEEAPCTVYVGNLISGITSDQLNKFFGSQRPYLVHACLLRCSVLRSPAFANARLLYYRPLSLTLPAPPPVCTGASAGRRAATSSTCEWLVSRK